MLLTAARRRADRAPAGDQRRPRPRTGSLPAALVSFAVGTLLLAVLVSLVGQAGGLSLGLRRRWYYLLGGVLGAAYVTVALVAVSTIGAGGVAAATITGQLTASVVIDRLGILGLEETPLHRERIAGVVLLLAGTYCRALESAGASRDRAARPGSRRQLACVGGMGDREVVAERPPHEGVAAHSAQRERQQAGGHPRDQPLDAQQPSNCHS